MNAITSVCDYYTTQECVCARFSVLKLLFMYIFVTTFIARIVSLRFFSLPFQSYSICFIHLFISIRNALDVDVISEYSTEIRTTNRLWLLLRFESEPDVYHFQDCLHMFCAKGSSSGENWMDECRCCYSFFYSRKISLFSLRHIIANVRMTFFWTFFVRVRMVLNE